MSTNDEWRDSGRERRKFVRKRVIWLADISCADGRTDCIVDDVSAGGACIRPIYTQPEDCGTQFRFYVGTLVKFEVIGLAHAGAKITWRERNAAGLEFLHVPDWAARLA